jgi:Ca2+/Na+ antiporter
MLILILIISWLVGGSVIFLLIRQLIVSYYLSADSIFKSVVYIIAILLILYLFTYIVVKVNKRKKQKNASIKKMQNDIIQNRNKLMNEKVSIPKTEIKKANKPIKHKKSKTQKNFESKSLKEEKKALSQVDIAAQKLKQDLEELNEHITLRQ